MSASSGASSSPAPLSNRFRAPTAANLTVIITSATVTAMSRSIWRTVLANLSPSPTTGLRVLKAIAVHLGQPADFFDSPVEDGNSILRLLHYPPVPPEADAVRAGAHEDINVITLLLGAEEAGLQLKDKDGSWLDIAPPPGALVVNIGDMLQRLTNHVLPSTTHRVVNPAPERRGFARYSTPFFLHFNPDFPIETLPSAITPDNPDRYAGKTILAEDYLTERLREIRLL